MRGFRIGAGLATAAAAVAALGPEMLGMDAARMSAPPPTRIQRNARVATRYAGGRSLNTPPKGMNGERECARRRRQIAAGSLTESNGLVR